MCCFVVGCRTTRKLFEVKETIGSVKNATIDTRVPLGAINFSDFIDDPPKPDLKLSAPINLPAPLPARNHNLQNIDTGLTHKAAEIIDGTTIEVIKDLDKQIKEQLNSNTTLTGGQSWLFYLMGAALIVCAAICLALKVNYTAICCGLAALTMFFVPTFIEAIHKMLKGLVWSFYACLAIGILSLIGWIGWKIYNHIPKNKSKDLTK